MIAPTAGGTAYYVASNGDDANPGTTAMPFRTINHAAATAKAGDVVIIRDGTYTGSVYVRNSGRADRPIVFQAENRGKVVLTGGHHIFRALTFRGSIGETPQKFITVKGLIFRNYAGNRPKAIALRAVQGWKIEDCLFDNAGETALSVNDHDVRIERVTFQNNYVHAFDVYGGHSAGSSPTDPAYRPVENLSVIDVVLHGNHTRGSEADATGVTSSRVVKVAMSRGLLIDNMESYENHGSGLWLDYKNSDYTIRNSYFHYNRGIVVEGEYRKENGRGIYLEKNWGPGHVENNVIADNEGAAIVIVNSNDVSFKHNLLVRNEQSVQLLNMTGSGYEEFTLKDVAFRGTYMKGWRSTASVWARGGDFSAGPSGMGLSMDESVYQLGSTGFLVQWPGPIFGARSLPQILAKYGWETRGRLESIPW
jgi:hypothetical protein